MFRRSSLWLNLAFSGLHEWLPCRNAININQENLKKVCQTAGISKIAFLRHGETGEAPENGVDFDRQLTDRGRKQAKSAGLSFGKDLRPFYHTLLVSPAPRTMETAEIFLKASSSFAATTESMNNNNDVDTLKKVDGEAKEEIQLKPVQNLYDGTMQPEGSELFRKLGYAPLERYLNSEISRDREVARTVLGAYAQTVIETVMDTIAKGENVLSSSKKSTSTTLWMVGHAIYLPAAALGVASLTGCDEAGQNVILSANTLEAEGYLIDIDGGCVKYLDRLK